MVIIKYYGDEFHKELMAKNHEIYRTAFRQIQKSRTRRNRYANRNTKIIDFNLNDPVFYKDPRRAGKLSRKWLPYYRIIQIFSKHSVLIKNTIDNSLINVQLSIFERLRYQIGI